MHTLTDRMGEDMRLRGFAARTQQSYRGAVAGLATHYARSPDGLATLTEAEVRAFFLHLVGERRVSRSTLMVYRSGFAFSPRSRCSGRGRCSSWCARRSGMCYRRCSRSRKCTRCSARCTTRARGWR